MSIESKLMQIEKLNKEIKEEELKEKAKRQTKLNLKQGKLFVVKNCKDCPNVYAERTPGAGYAENYRCSKGPKNNNLIAGYVEWNSDGPFDYDFPKFCPLKTQGK